MKYTVISSSPSIDQNTGQQYKDQYGNLSWNVMANDEQSQTYSFLKRTKEGNPAPKVGDVLEGEMKSEISKTGRQYWKFVAEKKWENKGGGSYSDPDTMLIAYAKDIVVALIANQTEKTKITTDNIKSDLETLTWHMKHLLDSMKTNTPEKTIPQTPASTTSAPNNEVTMDEINQVFPEEE